MHSVKGVEKSSDYEIPSNVHDRDKTYTQTQHEVDEQNVNLSFFGSSYKLVSCVVLAMCKRCWIYFGPRAHFKGLENKNTLLRVVHTMTFESDKISGMF